MTSPPITPLSPALRRVANQLMAGLDARQIAAMTGMALETVRQYVRDIRSSLHCPPRCKTWVVVHFALATDQVKPPTPQRPAPELEEAEQLLLTAVAENSISSDIARAARLAPADLRKALDALLDKTATTNTQLIVLAHGWGLLGANMAKGAGEQ